MSEILSWKKKNTMFTSILCFVTSVPEACDGICRPPEQPYLENVLRIPLNEVSVRIKKISTYENNR